MFGLSSPLFVFVVVLKSTQVSHVLRTTVLHKHTTNKTTRKHTDESLSLCHRVVMRAPPRARMRVCAPSALWSGAEHEVGHISILYIICK